MLEFRPMDDPLKIPEDKRGSGGLSTLFERPDHGWWVWIVLAALLVLNGWFDYYHRVWILLDIIAVIIWAVRRNVRSGNE